MLRTSVHPLQPSDCFSSLLSHMCHSPSNRKLQNPIGGKKHGQKLKLSQIKKKISPSSNVRRSLANPQSPNSKKILNRLQKQKQDSVFSELVNYKSPQTSKMIQRQRAIVKFSSTQKPYKCLSPPPRPKPSQRHTPLMHVKSQSKIKTAIPPLTSKINFIYKTTTNIQHPVEIELPIIQSGPIQKVKQFQQPEYNYQHSNVKTRESYLQNSNSTNKCTSTSDNKKSLIQGPRFAISIAGSSNQDFQDNQQSLVIERTSQKQSSSKFLFKLL